MFITLLAISTVMVLGGVLGFFFVHFRTLRAMVRDDEELLAGSVPVYFIFIVIYFLGMVGGIVTVVLRFFEYIT